MKSRFSAVIGEQDIMILYDGTEVMYWEMNEWVEDPTVALAAANAVRMAYEEPDKLYEKLRELGKI